MSWVRIDDAAPEHVKLLSAGAKAAWFWVCAIAYCNRQKRRDGFVPEAKVKLLYPGLGQKEVERLLAVGLLEHAFGGFKIHDYGHYQGGHGSELSEKRAAAGRLGGQSSGEARRSKQRSKPEATCFDEPKQTSEASLTCAQPRAGSHPIPSHPIPDPTDTKNQDLTGSGAGNARGAPPAPPVFAENQEDSGRETICPLDLEDKAERAGVLTELAEKLPAPIESVRAETREFVAYWTIGGGQGRKRTAWMRKLRQRIVERHAEGRLKPPGAIEHERNELRPSEQRQLERMKKRWASGGAP